MHFNGRWGASGISQSAIEIGPQNVTGLDSGVGLIFLEVRPGIVPRTTCKDCAVIRASHHFTFYKITPGSIVSESLEPLLQVPPPAPPQVAWSWSSLASPGAS